MRTFPLFTRLPRALAALALAVLFVQSADAQPTTKPVKKQKPAGELIQKQARPRVVPRVLDRAKPDATRLLVKLGDQRAILLVGNEVAIDTPISSGKRAGMTPKGSFVIVQKNKDHRSNIYGNFVDRSGQIVRGGVSTRIDSAPSGTVFQGAPMKYFMRLGSKLDDYTAVGLHVGHLPGYPASHGCIRLPEDIAPLIYDRVQKGTPVVIQD